MDHRTARRAVGVLALATLAACGGAGADRPAAADREGSVAVVDDAGRTVRLPAPAHRVVSLVPSVTEIVVALGAADRLVARTRYDDDPVLADLPSVGGGLDPSLERILDLAPDLVVAWDGEEDRALRPRLEAEGVPVYGAAIEDTAAALATIERFGRLLGREAAAARLAGALRDTLRAVAADVRDGPRPTAFYLVMGDPPRTAGAASFIGQAIAIAGGRSPFPELAAPWPTVALEAVIARDPDVLVLPSGPGLVDAADLAARPGWRDLPALREGRVVTIDADLLARPGPRLGAATRALQRGIASIEAAP